MSATEFDAHWGGDDPANNGHVESEIGQLKRRVRLLLSHTKQTVDSWPSAIRYAAEERFRTQMKSFESPKFRCFRTVLQWL